MLSRRTRRDGAKRLFDLIVAVPALLLVALPLLALVLIVRMDSPGGAIFRQQRIGRNGRPFVLYKLRTFLNEHHGFYGDEEIRWRDPRITRVGGWLRRTKLDELPQLLNVLRGDMSIVGPRPSMPEQVAQYSARERRRLLVRPGLTGVAQVSGNTWIDWPLRIRLDRWYVAKRSLLVDIALLCATLPVVLRGERPSDDPLRLRSGPL